MPLYARPQPLAPQIILILAGVAVISIYAAIRAPDKNQWYSSLAARVLLAIGGLAAIGVIALVGINLR